MNIAEYKEMSEREDSYWWHTGRMNIVDKQLQRIAQNKKKLRILNIGCGTGGTIPTLEKYGSVTNVDISAEALRFLKIKGYTGKLIKDHLLPFKDGDFDVVVALDVLEHINQDRLSLDEWNRVLKKNGVLVVTVPAYEFLWSGHDTSLHHQRRYTRNRLDWDLQKSAFRKLKNSYMITFSFFLVVGFRMLYKVAGRKMTENTSYVNIPRFVNNLFDKLLRIEGSVLRYINLPFGTTVLGIYEKHKG